MTEFGRFEVILSSKTDPDARKRAIADARKEMGTTKEEAASAEKIVEQIFARQGQRVEKNKQLKKSIDDVSDSERRSIELRQRLIKLHQDYEKVQEERGRKSSIRSKKELQATIDEATILEEILGINEELGTKNDRLEKRYAKLKTSIELHRQA
jgi:hypothetical protein